MNRRTFLSSLPPAISLPAFLWNDTTRSIQTDVDSNESICKKKFEFAASHKLHNKPIGTVVLEIAKSFLGSAYEANTIEAPGEEKLVVHLQSFDCVTFYETALVLARCIKKKVVTFDNYKKELQFVRYRGGEINGYPSRLHYTVDYFLDNARKNVFHDVTQKLGGVPIKKKIDFMTMHVNSYPRLMEFPAYIKQLQKIEDELSNRVMYYIPKGKVKKVGA